MTRASLVLPLVFAAIACSGDKSAKAKDGAASDKPARASKAESDKKTAPAKVEVGTKPLKGGRPSLEALGEAVVAALNKGDGKALLGEVVAEQEFKQRLFAALATNPRSVSPGAATLAWRNQHNDNVGGMTAALQQHSGKSYTFVRLEAGQTETRPGLVVHRNPALVVKDPQGAEHSLPLLETVLEHPASGTFKVLTLEG